MNVEPAEGILVPEAEAEVEIAEDQATASPRADDPVSDEEAKKNLRDQLRKTLSQRADAGGEEIEMLKCCLQLNSCRRAPLLRKAQGKACRCWGKPGLRCVCYGYPHLPFHSVGLNGCSFHKYTTTILRPYRCWKACVHQVCPNALFSILFSFVCMRSRQEDEDSDTFTSVIGLMQALISVFLDDGDKLRCINAGSTRIAFLLRPPLYYACVSSWGEPESVVRPCYPLR